MDKIEINTGVDPKFLENVITRDISTQASIFDLIDNSIDAAKESLISDKVITFDEHDMPSDYSGFKIYIKLETNSFKISDNCFGINEKTLATDTLIVGKESDHSYGLGRYGIGLKRALLKFGSDYSLITDTSYSSFKLHFNSQQLANGKKIYGSQIQTKFRKKTLFVVNNLKPLVKNEFINNEWQKKLHTELSQRYAIFLRKGLKIVLKLPNKSPVSIVGKFPIVADNPRFPCFKEIKSSHDVKITIEYGLHKDYNLGAGYGGNKLDDVTPFGWYVVCNDRVIEIAIRNGDDYGWKKNWHNEYNGFIGILRFDCKQVEHLPWDSTKTKITTDSLVFLAIKEDLGMYSLNFRREAKKILKNLKEEKGKADSFKVSEANKKQPSDNNQTGKISSDDKGALIKSEVKVDPKRTGAKRNIKYPQHTKEWETLLPNEFLQHQKNWTLNNLLIEAKKIKIGDFPHASALLYRSILEESLSHYIKNKFSLDSVREHYYIKGEGKNKEHNEEYKKNISVTLSMMMHWLIDSDGVFPKDRRSKLKSFATKAKGDIKELNRAVHGQCVVDRFKMVSIRNNSFELIEYFVEES